MSIKFIPLVDLEKNKLHIATAEWDVTGIETNTQVKRSAVKYHNNKAHLF